jgi:hypothetical protein
MPSLFDMVTAHLDENALQQLSSRLGTDQGATSKGIAAAIPVLLGALAHNAQQGAGAQQLNDALARDHDGSVLNDVPGTIRDQPVANGDAILGHVLGDRQGMVEQAVARASGLDLSKAGPLLAMLAPLVMGSLGKLKQQGGLGPDGLTRVLNGERDSLNAAAPGVMGIVSQLLDRNHDGSVLDDVGHMLSGLFGRR